MSSAVRPTARCHLTLTAINVDDTVPEETLERMAALDGLKVVTVR